MSATAKVMVVDDEKVTRQCLSSYFKEEGYTVFCSDTAEEAEALLRHEEFDVVLLDIRLPGKDGLTLTRELRTQSEVGIILMTGRRDELDRIIGLECGADEYISKPFNNREILARTKNLVRRVRHARLCAQALATQQNMRQFGRWRLDLDRRHLIDSRGEATGLTEGEFQLLNYLLIHAGEVLSRDQIMESIRQREWLPNDRTVDVLVGRLRRKLGDDATSPHLILTVHGAGYLFAIRPMEPA